MSRILIVTAWYHPFIHPRAHRWTSLAEYWAAEGHEVQVVTARQKGCPKAGIHNGVLVHRSGFDSLKELFYYYFSSRQARGRVGQAVQSPGRLTWYLSWLYTHCWKRFYFPDDAVIWYFPAKRKVLQLLEKQTFDVLITVSLPFTDHLIGLAAKRRFPHLRWLADIGDPFSFQAQAQNNHRLYDRINRKMEKSVLEKADTLSVTTAFTLEEYKKQFGPDTIKNMVVIPPLLHPPPADRQPYAHTHTSTPSHQHTLGYFGALYAPLRTPDAFLDLLERTFALRPDLIGRLQVHWYGAVFPEFYQKLRAQTTIQLQGLRSREEVRTAMQEMDVLLNIGNTSGYQLPSKAADYLASGKPVLHLSYTENDAFEAFFANTPDFLTLKVEQGKVEDTAIRRWVDWLEGPRQEWVDMERVGEMLIGAVASAYHPTPGPSPRGEGGLPTTFV